jgi:hypothetical protein
VQNSALTTVSLNSVLLTTFNMYLGAQNRAGSPLNYHTNEFSYEGALKRHLTPTEHTNYYNTIQALQTALFREV